MKYLQSFCFGLAIAFCTSCAHFQGNLSPTATADEKSAILYGRFTLSHRFSAGLKMALWLQNVETGKAIYIGFSESEPLCVIRIKRGTYQIAGCLGTNRGHQILHRTSLTPLGPGLQITRPFMAAPGSQIYLGDFAAKAWFDQPEEHWELAGITNNFTATTMEFREKYPRLRSVPAASIFDPQQVHP